MMRKLIIILVAITMFSMTAYAGQWKQDETGWKYQDDTGEYKTGWYQDEDEKWYYFDMQTAYMLTDAITPDGYKVSTDGVWYEKEEEMFDYNGYTKKKEVEVSVYDSLPNPQDLGYVLPVEIYHNDEYDNIYGGQIKISKIEISKEGLVYILFDTNGSNGHYKLNVRSRYTLPDGTYKEIEENVISVSSEKENNISVSLLHSLFSVRRLKPILVEVFIDEATKQ